MLRRILVLDALGEPRRSVNDLLRRYLPDHRAIYSPPDRPFDVRHLSPEERKQVDGIVTAHVAVDHGLVHALPNLRVVSLAATGTGAIEHLEYGIERRGRWQKCKTCNARRIDCPNVRNYATDSTADLVIGLTIALLRRIIDADRAIRTQRWNTGLDGVELRGKTVGVIGTGNIASAVAKRFRAFGCRILICAHTEPTLRVRRTMGRAEYVSLARLFRASHVVTVHIPGIPPTRGMIRATHFERMKHTRPAIFINAARSSIVEGGALENALRVGWVTGAGIDVHAGEALARGSEILAFRHGTVLTPHIGYRTREALQNALTRAMKNLKTALAKSRRRAIRTDSAASAI